MSDEMSDGLPCGEKRDIIGTEKCMIPEVPGVRENAGQDRQRSGR